MRISGGAGGGDGEDGGGGGGGRAKRAFLKSKGRIANPKSALFILSPRELKFTASGLFFALQGCNDSKR